MYSGAMYGLRLPHLLFMRLVYACGYMCWWYMNMGVKPVYKSSWRWNSVYGFPVS